MLRLPAEQLPRDLRARQMVLRNYFHDKDASAVESKYGWTLSLAWPAGVERHVDPRLDEGLQWWRAGTTRSGMARERRRSGRILTSLYDTWTLVSWSEWLARQGGRCEKVTILHADDHRDLDAPRLFLEGDVLRDPITGATVILDNPPTVRRAIMSGALGMGSFMTLFLRYSPHAEVRHLCQPPKTIGTIDLSIVSASMPDTLLDPGAPRPAIILEPGVEGPGRGRYRVTSEVKDWLAGLSQGPILLHLDMDYFNNRYDGDSDWAEREPRFDPSLEVVLTKIDEIIAALSSPALRGRIEDVVVAYSPGFFPAEFWSAADARLRPGLERLL